MLTAVIILLLAVLGGMVWLTSANGSLTATGSVSATKDPAETTAKIQAFGTYGTVTYVVECTLDGATWAGVACIRDDTNAVVPGGTAIAPSDNQTLSLTVPGAQLFTGIRLRVTAIASGTLQAYIKCAAFTSLGQLMSVSVVPQTNTNETNTAITTAGAGTLTAAALIGGVITRSGPTADYTDTTDTAALIIAAIPAAVIGQSWEVTIKNTVAYTCTLAGGTGVTLSGQSVIPPLGTLRVLVRLTSATAVSIQGLSVGKMVSLPGAKFTADATGTQTADAGDLTGAEYVVWENTANGAVALTTRTAAQMFADIPNCQIGYTYLCQIVSQGDNTVTLTAGTGVTITGTATVATKVSRLFTVTFTSGTAVTFQSVSKGTIE